MRSVPAYADGALADAERVLTSSERAELLRTHRAIVATLDALGTEIEAAPEDGRDALLALEERLFERESDLREVYLDALAAVAVSRSPYDDEVLWRAIDTTDLDGLFWRAEAAVRSFGTAPRTFVALTGAMRLDRPIARAAFLAKPGPAVPYVLPRLLGAGTKAVLSTVPVGPHTGYAIAYFSDHPERVDPRVDEWGGDGAARVVDGVWSYESWPEQAHERDFDLLPWIERGALLWIAPGDGSLTLRSGAAGCAYLGLEGTHAIQRVEDGTIR